MLDEKQLKKYFGTKFNKFPVTFNFLLRATINDKAISTFTTSSFHDSNSYICFPHHKPISKFLENLDFE